MLLSYTQRSWPCAEDNTWPCAEDNHLTVCCGARGRGRFCSRHRLRGQERVRGEARGGEARAERASQHDIALA